GVRLAGQRLAVAVHVLEDVRGIVVAATGLDCLVRTRLGAEAAVHADAEIDLVAVDVERAIRARGGLHQDAAIRARLCARRTAGAALLEPEQVRASARRHLAL